jgi:ornithine cyclodeaminase/alanine dehydrogenase-like protein (mu-crystallin family)
MDPQFINKEKVASLLSMGACISVMDKMFRALDNGDCLQPLRSLMWLPDKTGLLGMMPGYAATLGVMGIKVISVFRDNQAAGYPSHQGIVILLDAHHGQPLMMFDAEEITAVRTAAVSALATQILSRENSEVLAIIGSGEQAERHIEAILLVRKIKQVNLWGRDENKVAALINKIRGKYNVDMRQQKSAKEAITNADIICTVTSSREPVVEGDWIAKGTHINAVGASTVVTRELDTEAVVRSKLYTDNYESIFNESGDFLMPKKEGAVTDKHVLGTLGEILTGGKKGREKADDITLFKSLGIAMEDIFSAWHIYQQIKKKPD